MPAIDTKIQTLILEELREIRSDYTEHARVTGERLSALEVGMRSIVGNGERLASLEVGLKSLIGNGQPGRITLLEQAVERLKEFRWYWLGGAAAISCVVALLIK
ncbi:MAG TPA: hypothetical protein VGG97_09525 [Bryobacteraceae bacterium]|jgi:hypothetical protein